MQAAERGEAVARISASSIYAMLCRVYSFCRVTRINTSSMLACCRASVMCTPFPGEGTSLMTIKQQPLDEVGGGRSMNGWGSAPVATG
jgi:hypothetical protein